MLDSERPVFPRTSSFHVKEKATRKQNTQKTKKKRGVKRNQRREKREREKEGDNKRERKPEEDSGEERCMNAHAEVRMKRLA